MGNHNIVTTGADKGTNKKMNKITALFGNTVFKKQELL